MEKRRNKRTVSKTFKTNSMKKSKEKSTIKHVVNKKKKIKPIIIVDYTFLISLFLSIIFGMQTNGAFLLPFTITLVVTIVCMCIILINAVYTKIRKKFKKSVK